MVIWKNSESEQSVQYRAGYTVNTLGREWDTSMLSLAFGLMQRSAITNVGKGNDMSPDFRTTSLASIRRMDLRKKRLNTGVSVKRALKSSSDETVRTWSDRKGTDRKGTKSKPRIRNVCPSGGEAEWGEVDKASTNSKVSSSVQFSRSVMSDSLQPHGL